MKTLPTNSIVREGKLSYQHTHDESCYMIESGNISDCDLVTLPYEHQARRVFIPPQLCCVGV